MATNITAINQSPASPQWTVETRTRERPAQIVSSVNTQNKPDQPTEQSVSDAVSKINDFVSPITSDIQFNIDEDTGMTVVKVVDRATKEVIRQIPSEEILTIAKALDNLKGLLVRQTA